MSEFPKTNPNGTIYRVECAEHKNGPFASSWARCHCNSRSKMFARITRVWPKYGEFHVEPAFEGYNISPDEICGVKDIRQLVYWFRTKSLRKYLNFHGFVIGIYESKNAHVLNTQVCFSRDSKRIGQLSLIGGN